MEPSKGYLEPFTSHGTFLSNGEGQSLVSMTFSQYSEPGIFLNLRMLQSMIQLVIVQIGTQIYLQSVIFI
jgi:hypothetical protein